MASSIELLAQLRELFPFVTLASLKKAAVYYKSDLTSYASFVQSTYGTNHFPQFPEQTDPELEKFLSAQHQFLKDNFPDADPAYIEETYNTHAGTDGIVAAVLDARSQPNRKQTPPEHTTFDVQLFCEHVPDPVGSFTHRNYIMTERMSLEGIEYFVQMIGEANRMVIADVVKNSPSLYLSHKSLRDLGFNSYPNLGTNPKRTAQPQNFESPDYEQVYEKLFIENEEKILTYLAQKSLMEMKQHYQECSVCLNPSTKLIKICRDGHEICGPCMKGHTELLYHEGALFFPCAFEDCTLLLSNEIVRSVWDTSLYSKLLEDRKNAVTNQLPGVACPFCNFRNENSDGAVEVRCVHCWKKFCVTCKKIGHLPLKCNEKENYLCKLVEEKMTEALIRKCPKCGTQFIKKRDSCNEMSCRICKVVWCYFCRKIVVSKGHFYGQGRMPSEAPGCCPRFSDINALHVTNVIQEGTKMLQKIEAENPDLELPYDPLAVLPKLEKSDAVPNQF